MYPKVNNRCVFVPPSSRSRPSAVDEEFATVLGNYKREGFFRGVVDGSASEFFILLFV